MKKKVYIPLTVILVLIITVWYFGAEETTETEEIKVPVKFGLFEISVATTGELRAKNSTSIYGAKGLRSIGIWTDIKINELVPEGTIVDSGDFVASLDPTEVKSKLKDLESELEKLGSQFIKTQLDTSLNLRNSRNELVNLQFAMEEREIEVDQSQYEPPATQRQAKINLDKSERAFYQAKENYILKYKKAKAEMQEVSATLDQARRKRDRMVDILESFTIFAPQPGMIIYKRNWRGRKTETGSTVGWDNIVAKLPDLTTMISKTYVNEIDISKVGVNQVVRIGVDAFPDKEYSGRVTAVANIGEQMPSSDAKVFEVMIDIHESDTILRPAMTTKNIIITDIIDSVFYIPLEAIHNNDSITYVFMDQGNRIMKQEVEIGQSNENEIIINKGLDIDDEVYLSIPPGADDLETRPLKK
ncbi:MAG: RND transporter [Bacteroidetes bacterium 4572_114]|nr:MAG: RND transporter [Bacteroidetes bacterium 4572_114]